MKILLVDIPTNPIRVTEPYLALSRIKNIVSEKFFHEKLVELHGVKLPPPRSYRLGLLYIASVLEQGSHQVYYCNMSAEDEFKLADLAKECDVMGVSDMTPTFPIVQEICKISKQENENIITVVGGPHSTFMDRETLKDPYIDIVVRGEGELTFHELIEHLEKDLPLKEVKGISFKGGNKIIRNPNRQLIGNLDTLPSPAYHLLPGGLGKFHAYIMSTRGCPYRCTFCSARMSKVRYFTPKRFVEEIRLCEELLGGKSNLVHVVDDTFTFNRKHANSICKLLKREGIDLSLFCNVRADTLNKDFIRTLYEDGNFIYFGMGIESVSDPTLNLIEKGIRYGDALTAYSLIKDFKSIFLKIYWITGLPGETHESLFNRNKEIRRLINKDMVDFMGNSVLTPYPGTPIFNFPEKYCIEITSYDWSRYDHRSFPPVYRLENMNGFEIYFHFLLTESAIVESLCQKYGMIDEFRHSLEDISKKIRKITLAHERRRFL